MSRQYGRVCSLVVGNAAGEGMELGSLRVRFNIQKADTQSPARAEIRVYNLSEDTARTIQKEFTHVFLQAGYEGNSGLIFSGAVRQYFKGRESPTDTFLYILAQDGDEGYNWTVVNTTLAAGWTRDDVHGRLMSGFAQNGLAAGYKPTLGGNPAPRARVLFGMGRDHMRRLAETSGATWHIQDGKINVVPVNGTLPGEAFVLNSQTGLIGLPQQTINGVNVKCLLNPKIKFAGQIQLNNSSIQQQVFNVAYNPGTSNNVFKQDGTKPVQNTGLDTDGYYKVCAITMSGDTRGKEWYSDLVCVGVDATAPLSGPFINATASSTGH